MKRIMKLLLTLTMVLTLVACGKTQPEVEQTEPETTVAPTATPIEDPALDNIDVITETQVTMIAGTNKPLSSIIRYIGIDDITTNDVEITPTDEIADGEVTPTEELTDDVTDTEEVVDAEISEDTENTDEPAPTEEPVPTPTPREYTEQEKSIQIAISVGEFEDTLSIENLQSYMLNLIEVGEHELTIKITAENANEFVTTVKLIVVDEIVNEVENVTDNIKIAEEVEDYNFERRLVPSDKIESVTADTSNIVFGEAGKYEVTYTVKPSLVEDTIVTEDDTNETASIEQPAIKVPVEVEIVDDTAKEDLIDKGVEIVDNDTIAKEDELEQAGKPVVTPAPVIEDETASNDTNPTEPAKVQKKRLVSDAVYENVLVKDAVPAKPAVYENRQVLVSPAVPAKPAVYEEKQVLVSPAVPAQPAVAGKDAVYKTEKVKVKDAVPAQPAIYEKRLVKEAVYEYYWE